jgi:S1-C subfamily serine protease
LIKKFLFAIAFALAPLIASAGSVKTDMLDPLLKINDSCSAIGISLTEGKRLLTAQHCVNSAKEGTFKVKFIDNEFKTISETQYYYDVVRTDADKDLALLKVRDEKLELKTVKIAENLIAQEGEQVWTVGYPLGFERVITEGLLNAPLVENFNSIRKTMRLRASPNLDGGNSGGGLFQRNKTDYELIGVTSMMFNSNRHMGIYIPLSNIREFLRLDMIKVNSSLIDQR